MARQPRIAHLGLGAFARSHQAWYTQAASDDWGIVGLSGRVLEPLAAQGFRYGMIVRGPESDSVTEIDSVIGAAETWATGGAALADAALADASPESAVLADPAIAIVTLTITEGGYLPGQPAAATLVSGLRARRESNAGPIAIVPCDNVPSNGRVIRDAVLSVAEPGLASWIDDTVSFVATMVDRITPAATEADREIASAALGWRDAVPVVTEPFTEWVLEGEFPAGRPGWEVAGAQFVDDVRPYENRKLWMLNGAHSLLAYRGLESGYETVSEAFADAALQAEVEQLWADARVVLDLSADDVDDWLDALRIRWANPRLKHRLAQIAQGGEQKIAARIFSLDEARRAAGLPISTAGVETVASWLRYDNKPRNQ
jgi:fructuronate reductase